MCVCVLDLDNFYLSPSLKPFSSSSSSSCSTFLSFSGGIFSSDSRPNFCVCMCVCALHFGLSLYTLCKVTRRSLELRRRRRGDWFGFYSNFLMSSYSLCSAAGEKTPAPLSSSFALPGARNQLECQDVLQKRDVWVFYTTSFLHHDRCVNDSRPQRKKERLLPFVLNWPGGGQLLVSCYRSAHVCSKKVVKKKTKSDSL